MQLPNRKNAKTKGKKQSAAILLVIVLMGTACKLPLGKHKMGNGNNVYKKEK